MKRLGKRGFTLIEMLIVVVVIGVLVAMAVPRFMGVVGDARTKACAGNIRAIDSACEVFNNRTGAYPTAIADVVDDVSYFPDGPPVCPFGVDYAALSDGTDVIGADRASHFAAGNWPDTHD